MLPHTYSSQSRQGGARSPYCRPLQQQRLASFLTVVLVLVSREYNYCSDLQVQAKVELTTSTPQDMNKSLTSTNRADNFLSADSLFATNNGRTVNNNDRNDSKHASGELKIECQNCRKETQKKPLPDVTIHSCTVQYEAVQKCMEHHHGQVSSCKILWEEFRSCHNNYKYNRKDGA